jgi:fido (protein-threonine AMPylation protein)
MMEFLSRNESFRKLLVLNASLKDFKGRMGLRSVDLQCISRDGRTTRYAQSSLVPYLLKLTLEEFEESYHCAVTMADLAAASAKFWVWFLVIHPFSDGNLETARTFLKTRLEDKGFEIFNFESIERFPLSGERSEEDVDGLTKLFIMSMRPVAGLRS